MDYQSLLQVRLIFIDLHTSIFLLRSLLSRSFMLVGSYKVHNFSMKGTYLKYSLLVYSAVWECLISGKEKLKLAEFTDEKVVCCPLCDFVTTNKNILNIHAHQKHEKDFVATNLNKITMTPKKPTITKSDTEIFERRNVLQKTKKKDGRRVVDKKFVCSICSKSFKRNPCLERHTLGVHLGISLNQYRNRCKNN